MFENLEKAINDANANVIRYLLYKDGEIFEHDRVACNPSLNCYSVSKNFTATAVGIAYDKGLLDVEDYIVDFFKNELPDNYDENLKQVKIKHLLTQTMGLSEGFLFEADRFIHNTDNWMVLALSAKLPFKPGEKFTYSNSTFYLLSCIVEKVAGMPMDMFLQQNMFKKVGITSFAWDRCPKGHTMGATGLYIPTMAMLKLGILYLNKGVWQGERVLSEKWVQMATVKSSEMADIPTAFGFWMGENGNYHCGGAYSQFIIVYPSKNIVIAAHSFDEKSDIFGILNNYVNTQFG